MAYEAPAKINQIGGKSIDNVVITYNRSYRTIWLDIRNVIDGKLSPVTAVATLGM